MTQTLRRLYATDLKKVNVELDTTQDVPACSLWVPHVHYYWQ